MSVNLETICWIESIETLPSTLTTYNLIFNFDTCLLISCYLELYVHTIMNENQTNLLVTSLGCVSHITKILIEENITSSSDEDAFMEEIPVQVRIRSDILCKIRL
jgi:hypothetical protein